MSVDLEECGNVFDIYKSVMNNFEVKTDIMQAIFQEKGWDNLSMVYMGSYMSFPDDTNRTEKLIKFYTNPTNGEMTVDAKSFSSTVNSIYKDIKSHKKYKYICFALGAIASDNNVSHHLGFIYDTHNKIVKIFDPGQRSWGPESAQIVKGVVDNVFSKLKVDVEIVNAFSGKWYCVQCIGPQDTCRGGYIDEFQTLISDHKSIHRESYCQTWSLILMLNQLQQIQDHPNVDFSHAELKEWAKMSKRELEICIRRFILWIVNKYPLDFENEYKQQTGTTKSNGYRKLILLCMKNFDPSINIPEAGTSMCGGITLTTFEKRRKKRRKKY